MIPFAFSGDVPQVGINVLIILKYMQKTVMIIIIAIVTMFDRASCATYDGSMLHYYSYTW